MRELVRTNDAVLISAIEALLKSAGIPHLLADQNMSVLEGSIGAFRAASWSARMRSTPHENCSPKQASVTNSAPMSAEKAATSEDAVLGGRLVLRQPLRGHRVGHDAILLAAATVAQSGEQAVDLGAGVGGAGLALARRIAGVAVTLVEIDPVLAALAAANAERNNLSDRVRAVRLDVEFVRRRFHRRGPGTGIRGVRADEPAVQCLAAAVARSHAPLGARGI